ncbi:MAG: ABC transporter ATP-binding protein, partial [Tepidisphaeraceae bacterium]
WWMLRYPMRRKSALLAVAGATFAGAALQLLSPWPMKFIVDSVVGDRPLPALIRRLTEALPYSQTRQGLLAWAIAATVALFFAGWAIGLASAYSSISFGQRMVYDLAADLFTHMQSLSVRFHNNRSVGDLIRRVTGDCGCVATIVRDAILPIGTAVLTLVGMLLIMWELSPALALLAMCVAPIMLLAFRLYAQPMFARGYEQSTAEAQLYTIVEQTLSSIPVVQAFCGEERASRQLASGTRAAMQAVIAATRAQIGFKFLIGLATGLGSVAIIAVGSRQVLAGQLTLGSLLLFLAYLGALYSPLNTMMYASSTVQGAAGSARRVMEVFEIDREVVDSPHARPVRNCSGQLAFEQVCFSYEPGRDVLRQLDLLVPAGTTLAIVGHSGAGKSTLAALVPRFFDPLSGRITLDGIDLRDLQLASLRQHVALVQQETLLFDMSVTDNIAYGNPRASVEQIHAAATAAGAQDFILRLPQGYNTLLGERGARLSGGERQRIAIARALLKDAPVLVLDEPTASLDAHTEAALMDALGNLMKNRTTLLIAHRLSTVRNADNIVVLHDGRILEQGNHHQLLARGGAYADLHATQAGRRRVATMQGVS